MHALLEKLKMSPEKLKVLGAHIALSLIIFLVLFSFIKVYWFPSNLIEIDGGCTVIKLIAGVNVILGPLLTLFFIHPERGSFKLNFAFIVSVQFIALFVGMWMVADQRVSVVVFSGEQFYSISNGTLTDASKILLDKNKEILDYKSDSHDVLNMAFVKSIGDGKNREDVFNGYPELPVRPDLFLSLEDNWAEVQKHQITDEKQLKVTKSHALMSGTELYDALLEIYNIKGRYQNAFILFDGKTKKMISIVLDE
jgi:hypothetical protein